MLRRVISLLIALVALADAQPYRIPPAVSGGSSAWSALTSGTNTTGAFICGTGCSILPGGSGNIVATNGALTTGGVYTGNHDFSGATVAMPPVNVRFDTGGNFTAGQRYAFSHSGGASGVAGFRLVCNTLPSGTAGLLAGDETCDASGRRAFFGGTNQELYPRFAGSGATLSLPGAGLAHFAGSTHLFTSSLVVSSDLNITTTTCTYPSVLTAIGATGLGTCTVPTVPQGSKSAAYTTVLGDAGQHIYHPSTDNNARTFTIDSNANVAYPIGTTITFVNYINTVTIAITSDTMFLAGNTATTGSRTLAAGGIATALKLTSTLWIINGTGLT